MATFRVLIVGGSVAGLTLANILERYGIEYTLIEKHAVIAPNLGASIAILPHGLRILDQLGCYDALRTVGVPIQCMRCFGPDGSALSVNENAGDHLEGALGYMLWRLDRQQLIEILFQNLRNKSRIQTSCGAFKVEHLDQGVRVETQDGRVITGSVLVGADGVHSRVRQEMWRIAESEVPGYCPTEDQQAITQSSYSCIFGISKDIGKVLLTDSWQSFQAGRHYLCQREANGKVYWFLFFKNTQRGIPHYTEEDRDKFAAQFEADILMPNLTFGDLWEHRTHAVLVPLEEYVLKRCYYRRIMLLGDSFHKFHPMTSQGGTSAIESAADLANQLKELTSGSGVITDEKLQVAFVQLQEDQRPKAEVRLNGGRILARLECLDNALFKFLMLHVVGKLSAESALPLITETCSSSVRLKYLPAPSRQGIVPFEDEVEICPRKRKPSATVSWMLVFFLIGSVRFIPFQNFGVGRKALSAWLPMCLRRPERYSAEDVVSNTMLSLLQTYFAASTLTMNGLWCLESYRNQFSLSPIGSTISFMLVSFGAGWEVAAALYFALHILFSRQQAFYYPSPRTVTIPVAKALPVALVLTYSIAILLKPVGVLMDSSAVVYIMGFGFKPWSAAHFIFPMAVGFVKMAFEAFTRLPKGPALVWGNADIPYISLFLALIFLVTSSAHVVFMANAMAPGGQISLLDLITTENAAQFVSFGISMIIWMFFTVWDLRRVHATNTCWRRVMLHITLGSILFGPASCLAVFWYWREVTLERSRTRGAKLNRLETKTTYKA